VYVFDGNWDLCPKTTKIAKIGSMTILERFNSQKYVFRTFIDGISEYNINFSIKNFLKLLLSVQKHFSKFSEKNL
jgi:hypothetical protein